MKFIYKDIIITDPCYIIQDHDDKRPKLETWPGLAGIKESTLISQFTPEQLKAYNEYQEAWKEFNKNYDDWSKVNYGSNFERIGIYHYICRDTIYGDWSCTVFNTDTNEKIGEFCADAGMVAVFELDEVLKYNPSFDLFNTSPWTTTLIKNFTGEVKFNDHNGEYVTVEGTGNINFIGKQTGF